MIAGGFFSTIGKPKNRRSKWASLWVGQYVSNGSHVAKRRANCRRVRIFHKHAKVQYKELFSKITPLVIAAKAIVDGQSVMPPLRNAEATQDDSRNPDGHKFT
ncbi:unnamed protein product [Soboliphyme baturini]|uniref:Transposase n=1 Tax=Soboliphyme baturini TaxID=241478 RepID=A0A183IZF6_9BILA|nr:unnamed protein product [Soboliphyme baturini]